MRITEVKRSWIVLKKKYILETKMDHFGKAVESFFQVQQKSATKCVINISL